MTDWEDIRVRFGDVVWTTCYRILAQESDALDCYQEVFLEAIERESLTDVQNWGGWLRWLATRRAIDHLRARKRRRCAVLSTEFADLTLSPENSAMFAELIDFVRDELREIPADQAQAFWLGCVEQLSYGEIAQQMQIKTGTVGVLIHRARERMKQRLMNEQLAPSPEANR